MKHRKRQNKAPSEDQIIRAILDREYFHVCTEQKQNGEIKWKVYYKNLPSKSYYSDKNKALLTSEKNSIEDIYKLKEKFENLKRIEEIKGLHEVIPLISSLNRVTLKYKNVFRRFSVMVIIILMFLDFINMFCIRDIILSIGLLISICIAGYSTISFQNKLEKIGEKAIKIIEKQFLKEKIKCQGFYFLDKIRN